MPVSRQAQRVLMCPLILSYRMHRTQVLMVPCLAAGTAAPVAVAAARAVARSSSGSSQQACQRQRHRSSRPKWRAAPAARGSSRWHHEWRCASNSTISRRCAQPCDRTVSRSQCNCRHCRCCTGTGPHSLVAVSRRCTDPGAGNSASAAAAVSAAAAAARPNNTQYTRHRWRGARRPCGGFCSSGISSSHGSTTSWPCAVYSGSRWVGSWRWQGCNSNCSGCTSGIRLFARQPAERRQNGSLCRHCSEASRAPCSAVSISAAFSNGRKCSHWCPAG